MSTCNTCGGSGEIPLLGAATTTCPDCPGYPAWVPDPEAELTWIDLRKEDSEREDRYRIQREVRVDVEGGCFEIDGNWIDIEEYATSAEELCESLDESPHTERAD